MGGGETGKKPKTTRNEDTKSETSDRTGTGIGTNRTSPQNSETKLKPIRKMNSALDEKGMSSRKSSKSITIIESSLRLTNSKDSNDSTATARVTYPGAGTATPASASFKSLSAASTALTGAEAGAGTGAGAGAGPGKSIDGESKANPKSSRRHPKSGNKRGNKESIDDDESRVNRTSSVGVWVSSSSSDDALDDLATPQKLNLDGLKASALALDFDFNDDVLGSMLNVTKVTADEEEEEDGEEEEGDEEEGEEAEDEEDDPEVLRDQQLFREQLINRYTMIRKEYLYSQKRNSYLQDRLYQICVRKGFIVETPEVEPSSGKDTGTGTGTGGKHDRDRSGKKQLKKTEFQEKLKLHMETTDDDHNLDDDDEDPDMDDPDLAAEIEEMELKRKHSSRTLFELGLPDTINNDPPPQDHCHDHDVNTGTRAFREQKRLLRYQKVIRHILYLHNSKHTIATMVDQRIEELKGKNQTCGSTTQKFFSEFMAHVRSYSRDAVNTNTGKHLDSRETEMYITEMNRLFEKLCSTILEFYKNWHGLNLEMKRMEELGTSGEQSLEYEQLCGEMATLREKVEYREFELEKTKAKITHAIQLLAHFKEKECHVDMNLEDRTILLRVVNERIQKLMRIREIVTLKFTNLKQQQKQLKEQSQLLDHPRLLRDYEKTNKVVTSLRHEKIKLRDQLHVGKIHISSLKKQIEKQKKLSSFPAPASASPAPSRPQAQVPAPTPTTASPSDKRQKLIRRTTITEPQKDTILNADVDKPNSTLSSAHTIRSKPPSIIIAYSSQTEQQQQSQRTLQRKSVTVAQSSESQSIRKGSSIVWNAKKERLLQLLENRHNEPWKQVRDKIEITKPMFTSQSQSRYPYSSITRIPC